MFELGSLPNQKTKCNHERLDSEREQGPATGSYLQPFSPWGAPVPPPLVGSATPPPDLPLFQQLLALLLYSLHRCAELLWTSCPWTFPTHNFPNQSLVIKVSGRDEENWGEYLRGKEKNREMLYTHSDLCWLPQQRLSTWHDFSKKDTKAESGSKFSESYLKRPCSLKKPGTEWDSLLLSALGCLTVHDAWPGVW